MRFQILLVTATLALAGCAGVGIPFLDDGSDAPVTKTAEVAPTPGAQLYEIKDADRGMVRRVKVLLNSRTIDTIVLSRSRTEATSYCCTADGCNEIQVKAACTTFKMICDTNGTCIRENTTGALRL